MLSGTLREERKMSRLVLFSFVLVVLALPPVAAAATLSGSRLNEYCSGPKDSAEDVACTQYIQGYVAGIEAGDGSKSKDARIWCFPKGATIGQARLVVEKYLHDRPEALHQNAGLLVGLALMLAFPCRNSN